MINKNLEDEQSNISNNKSSVSLRLNSIPSLYQSSSFNFLSEIINVIAKTNNNSEELNKKVEFLNNYNEHIDQIVKSFVTQNSTSIKNIITITIPLLCNFFKGFALFRLFCIVEHLPSYIPLGFLFGRLGGIKHFSLSVNCYGPHVAAVGSFFHKKYTPFKILFDF